MGLQQSKSKEELLYEKSIEGDIEAIKTLSSQGAGLEWINKEGKTPLIAACMNHEHYILARTLIELGANVNAYRSGLHAGTPMHHAAMTSLVRTVRLLLSNGGTNLLFSGWLTEFYGPGTLEVNSPKFLTRKIWVVVIPCALPTPDTPLELELAIYSNIQDAQPRAVVALWRADIEEPKISLQDPSVSIFYKATRTRYKFAASNNGDKQQIQSFYLACRGISQVIQASAPTDTTQAAEASAINSSPKNSTREDSDSGWSPVSEWSSSDTSSTDGWIAEEINLHSTQTSEPDISNNWGNSVNDTTDNKGVPATESSPPKASTSGWKDELTNKQHNRLELQDPKLSENTIQAKFTLAPAQSSGWPNEMCKVDLNRWGVTGTEPAENNTKATYMPQSNYRPSAPPIPMDGLDSFLYQYQPIELSHAEFPVPSSVEKILLPKPNNSTQNLGNLDSWIDEPTKEQNNDWRLPTLKTIEATYMPQSQYPIPMEGLNGGPIQYPSIDFSPVEFSFPSVENEKVGTSSQVKDEDSSCVICGKALVEGAFPCDRITICMTCLNDLKTKRGDCPVCRAKIIEVIRIYVV